MVVEPLKVADFWRESRACDVPWIFVECPGGSYSPGTAIGAIQKVLEAKIAAYRGSHSSVRLLVYYGAAFAYNTPWFGIKTRKFSDVAKEAARIAANQSAFERIYLLKALEAGVGSL